MKSIFLVMIMSGFSQLHAEIKKGFYSFFHQTKECKKISKIVENSEFRLIVNSWKSFEVNSDDQKPIIISSIKELKVLVNKKKRASASIVICVTSDLDVGESELKQLIELFQNSGNTKFILVEACGSGFHVVYHNG